MVELGIMLKNTSAGEFNLLMRYWEMRVEAKKLTKAEHDVIRASKVLQRHLKYHNIEKVQKDMDKENKAGYEAGHDTHRMLINDFVCLRVLEKLAKETDEILKRMIKEKKIAGKLLKEVEKEEVELTKDTKVKVNDLLQTSRRIVDGLEHRCEGREDLAFFFKRKFFLDSRILNYFKLRWEARAMRRDIETEKKKFKKIADELNKLKAGKAKAKELKVLPKDIHAFRDATIKAIAQMFKVFTNSTILLDRVIGVFHDQVKEDDKLMAAHEIPMVMGQHDEEVKKQTLNYIKASLHDVNKARLQLEL